MNTLKDALRQLLPAEIEVFSYCEDFSTLWDRPTLGEKSVIIWDETPNDELVAPINTTSAVSPLDLALALTQQAGDDIRKWPRITIVPLSGSLFRYSPTCDAFLSLRQDRFPWLRIVQAADLVRPADSSLSLAQQLFPEPCGCKDTAQTNRIVTVAREKLAHSLRRALVEGGARAEVDRHALSNLLAPTVLRGGKVPIYQGKRSIHAPALRKVLEITGLVPASQNDGQTTGEPSISADQEAVLDTTGIQLTLLDDQARHGWQDWLTETCHNGQLCISTSPVELIRRIKSELTANSAEGAPPQNDLRFRLVPGNNGKCPEDLAPVLLLDLRLFAGNPEEEVRFLREDLLPLIVERFLDREDLAWPSFRSDEPRFEAASVAVRSNKLGLESNEHHETLTWLPRVLALADMSLPIIIFSSTGRRDLIDPLRPYRNVITSFEKPRLTDISEQSVEATVNNLKEALDSCRKMHRARRKATFVSGLRPLQPADLPAEGKPHIELYLDEKFDRFWNGVGGVFAAFASKSDARQFDDELVRNGLNYFDRLGLDPQSAMPPAPKSEDALPKLENAINAWRNSGRFIRIGVASLEDSSGKPEITSDLTNPEVADNRYRVLLGNLIEHFLAEMVPSILGERVGTVSIYCGTRLVCIENAADRVRAIQRFGLRSAPFNDALLYSFESDDLAQVAAEALRHHPDGTWGTVEIDRCLAFPIPYFNQQIGRNVPPFGYISADRPSTEARVIQGFGNTADFPKAVEYAWLNNHAVTFHDNRSNGTKCWFPRTDETADVAMFSAGSVVGKDSSGQLFVVTPGHWKSTDVSSWRPDIPLLLYAADCILRPGGMQRCPGIEKSGTGVVDDVFDPCFQKSRDSGRMLDRSDFGEALRMLPDASQQSGDLRHCVINTGSRLAHYMNFLNGEEFFTVVDDREQAVYRAVVPRQAMDSCLARSASGTNKVRFLALNVNPSLKEKIHGVILAHLNREGFPNCGVSSPNVFDDEKKPGQFAVSFKAEFTGDGASRIIARYGKGSGSLLRVKKFVSVLVNPG